MTDTEASADATEPEEIITAEHVPQGANPELPITGGVPSFLFVLGCVPVLLAGLKLKKKVKYSN